MNEALSSQCSVTRENHKHASRVETLIWKSTNNVPAATRERSAVCLSMSRLESATSRFDSSAPFRSACLNHPRQQQG